MNVVSLILPTELKKQCTPSNDAAHTSRNITKSNPLPVLVSKTTKPYETGCRIESLSLQIRESLEMRLEGEAKKTSHGSFEFVSIFLAARVAWKARELLPYDLGGFSLSSLDWLLTG